jgi:hypothetical protein
MTLRQYVFLKPYLCALSLSLGIMGSSVSAKTLYVSAIGPTTGTGTLAAPYNTLAQVELASAPGDTIIILAAPVDTPPLDGGIALKRGQTLVGEGPKVATETQLLTTAARIANTTDAHNGDAVVMADNSSASNIVIATARRAGVYIGDVTGVTVAGNVISAANSSCTASLGYEGRLFTGRPMHGYAAIMADYAGHTASLSVLGNRIHDGTCMDGIHIGASKNSVVSGRIDNNVITRLQQGKMFISVLGIALETKDDAILNVTSDGNSQTFIGNPLGGAPDADCEGLLSHQTGGQIRWTITRNHFAHGMGGSSCNGAEFFISENHANSTIAIFDSIFRDTQGDMVQNINLGTGETTLTMERVSISHTHLAVAPNGPPESRGSHPAGNEAGRPRGHCVLLVAQGPGGVNRAKIAQSDISDCAGDGVFMYYAPFLAAPGESRELSMDIDRSTISSSHGYGVRWANYGAVQLASVKMRNSFVVGSIDKAAVALMQSGSIGKSAGNRFDFGTMADFGGNCLGLPGPRAVELDGTNASFVGNFWSSQILPPSPDALDQPLQGNSSAKSGPIDARAPLKTPPSTCGHS